MSFIPFPDVPALPGVPDIPRSPNFPPSVRAGLGLLQGLLWRTFQVQTQWGIFDSNGNPLGDPSKFTGQINSALGLLGSSTLSTNSVDYSKETRISDFPLERGSFANYNKVEMPAAPVVTLCFQGSETERGALLSAIDAACKSTDLYSVVTPEKEYIGYSLDRYNYSRRSNKGATLLTVEITLKEIRQVSASYTQSNRGQIDKPKAPSAMPQGDNGKVQAQTPNQSTLKSISKALPALADKVGTYLQGMVN